MQVKDKRDTSPPQDVRRPIRVLAPTYRALPSDSESDLFAQIFQGIAQLTAPQPANKFTNVEATSDDEVSDLTPVEEAASSRDDEDDSRDDVVTTAVPVLQAPFDSEPEPSTDATTETPLNAVDCQAKKPAATDDHSPNATSLNEVRPADQTEKPVVVPATTELQSDATVQALVDDPMVVSDDASTVLATDDGVSKPLATKLQATDPESATEAQPEVVAESLNRTSDQPALSEVSGATVGNSAGDASETPRDRRDRRSRGNESDARPSSVSTAEAAKERLAESNSAVPLDSDNLPHASPNEVGISLATEPALMAASTVTSVPVASTVVAATAAVVGQTLATSTPKNATSGESSTSSAPVVGGVSGVGADASERVDPKSTPATRQAEVADRARLVHRIAKAFQKMGVDGGQVRLRMHPDDLGSVQLDMQVSGRKVSATVIAESDEAVQLLQGSLPELRQKLESQGLVVERLDVERRTEDETGRWRGQNQSQNQNGYGEQSGQRDDLWGRSATSRDNSNSLKPRESLQNAVFTTPAATSMRAILPGDRGLDLKA